jgi:hypothetical protein
VPLTFNTGMEAANVKPISTRRIGDNPGAEERRDIRRRIRLLPLMRRDTPGVLDWPALAARLAEELDATSQRLAAARDLTDADAERIARASVVLRDYQTAAAAEKGLA